MGWEEERGELKRIKGGEVKEKEKGGGGYSTRFCCSVSISVSDL